MRPLIPNNVQVGGTSIVSILEHFFEKSIIFRVLPEEEHSGRENNIKEGIQ
jgi:hypothetical protein